MVLPSTATTLRLAMVPVRVQNQDLRRVLRTVGSRFRRTRRMVDSEGGACHAARPRDRRSAAVRPVVCLCSLIGVRLRHMAVTTVTARDRTVGGAYATPRRSRGSLMLLRTLVRGWRDRKVVISAGSQDEGMTRHHSSSLRGPRPRLSDTPSPSNQLRHPHPPTLPTPCHECGPARRGTRSTRREDGLQTAGRAQRRANAQRAGAQPRGPRVVRASLRPRARRGT